MKSDKMPYIIYADIKSLATKLLENYWILQQQN